MRNFHINEQLLDNSDDRSFPPLTQELKEYGITDTQIKRCLSTLNRGQTARTIDHSRIDCIFINDDGLAEMIVFDDNGRERSVICELS